MNIAARLIGVGTFAYFLVMFCLLIIYTNISVRSLLGWYAVVLAVMGFFYEPYITSDLYRIRGMMVTFSTMELPAFIRTYVTNSAVPVARLLYWLVGRTGVLGLLPALASMVSYGCIFYILQDAARRCGSKRQDVALTLLFIMAAGQYMFTVSNIRTMIAMSLICLCLYRETVQKKRTVWNLPLYLMAATMHTMAIPAIAMRVLLPIFYRKMSFWKKAAFLTLVAAVCAVVYAFVPNLADELREKVDDYLFGDSYSYFWEYLIGAIALFVEVYVLRIYAVRAKIREEVWDAIHWMLTLCVGAAIAFCFIFSVFHRLVTYIAPILAIPLMLSVLREEPAVEPVGKTQNRRTLIAVVSLCMLVLTCSRGSLCSFKFF